MCHRQLVGEVGAPAQAFDHGVCLDLAAHVDDEGVGPGSPTRTLGRWPSVSSRKAVRSSTPKVPCLAGLCRIATTTSSKSPGGAGDDVDVPVGHGVVGAGAHTPSRRHVPNLASPWPMRRPPMTTSCDALPCTVRRRRRRSWARRTTWRSRRSASPPTARGPAGHRGCGERVDRSTTTKASGAEPARSTSAVSTAARASSVRS